MVNCKRCEYMDTDNGNCTAVGGFCTAVPAAHCVLLQEYMDAYLTPAEVHSLWYEWNDMMSVLNSIGGYDRLHELVEADKAGRLMVLPESKEHQRKTRQDVFLEQWPEVKLFDGIIDIKPCDLVASLRSECPKTFCYECRHKFWMQEWSDG